jgi:hypothetical protein
MSEEVRQELEIAKEQISRALGSTTRLIEELDAGLPTDETLIEAQLYLSNASSRLTQFGDYTFDALNSRRRKEANK